MKIYPWQTEQWQQVISAHQAQCLPHALLLEGPRGIGLSRFSRALGARLLCKSPKVEFACGICTACKLVRENSHPDLVVVKPKEADQQIKIGEIRELIDFIQLTSHAGKSKVVIIDPANMMNRSASNALLKTLEEPPENSLLILNTQDRYQLPITIRSRCQKIRFSLRDTENIRDWLQDQLGSGYDLDLLLHLAGTPLAVLKMVEEEQLVQRDQILTDLERIKDNKITPLAIGDAWSVLDTGSVIIWLQRLFMDMIRLRTMKAPPGLDNIYESERLHRLLDRLDLKKLLACGQLLAKLYAKYSSSVGYNTRTMMEEFAHFWQTIETRGG